MISLGVQRGALAYDAIVANCRRQAITLTTHSSAILPVCGKIACHMRRKTAIRLYGFLFVIQILSICAGLVEMISDPNSQLRKFIPGSLIGVAVGIALAVLWYRQWKRVKGISEEQWNRAWFIDPRKP